MILKIFFNLNDFMISNLSDSMILCLSVYMVPASFECGMTMMIQVKSSSLVYKDYLDFLAVKKPDD